MILEANNSKDFVLKLIDICTIDTRYSFEKKIKKIKELGSIDTTYYKNENGIQNSFEKPFKFSKRKYYSQWMNFISSADCYTYIVSKGIERLVQSIFKTGKVREMLDLIICKDKSLLSALFSSRFFSNKLCIYSDADNTKEYITAMIFPFAYDDSSKSLWMNESIPSEFSDDYLSTYHLFSLIFGSHSIPLGKYELYNNFELSNEKDIYEEIDGKKTEYIMYSITPDLTSFIHYENESLREIMYNSAKGKVYYSATQNLLKEIETEIHENSDNAKYLKLILECLSNFNYEGNSILFEGLKQIDKCLNLIGMGYEEWLSTQSTIKNKIFINIIKQLDTSFLFRLLDKSSIKVIDEFSVVIKNYRAYIIKTLTLRFRSRPELDLTIRQFLNQSDTQNTIKLLEIFNDTFREG